MLLNEQSLQSDRGTLHFNILSLPGLKHFRQSIQPLEPSLTSPHRPGGASWAIQGDGHSRESTHSVCGNKLSLAPYNLAEQHLLEMLLENRGQLTDVCDCQVGEYVNHLITNFSLRRVFKHTANETGKLARRKPFFKICNYFKGVSCLKYVLHEKQFVLIQVTAYGTVLSEQIFMQKQQVMGSKTGSLRSYSKSLRMWFFSPFQ